jgi:LacI family transcriptional regulator
VRQPIAELAAFAVRTLIGHLDGVALPPGRIELSTALVVPGSTAPPPA